MSTSKKDTDTSNTIETIENSQLDLELDPLEVAKQFIAATQKGIARDSIVEAALWVDSDLTLNGLPRRWSLFSPQRFMSRITAAQPNNLIETLLHIMAMFQWLSLYDRLSLETAVSVSNALAALAPANNVLAPLAARFEIHCTLVAQAEQEEQDDQPLLD